MQNETQKFRLNLVLTEPVKLQLDDLQASSSASSVTEVLRRAIALYHMVTDHLKTGGTIVLRSADKKSEEVIRLL